MAHPLDPLALPPVPPPAPATHPLRDAIVATLFGAALALTGLAALKTPAQTTLDLENRSIAAWPRFAPSPTFTADFERAFGDRFGARTALFRLHHVALAELFGVSPVANVLLGRDDWLYFLGEDGKSLDRHFRGTLATAEADIVAVTAELRRRERFLASLNIPYVITIVPEKFTIYPEHLPSWAVKSAAPTPLDRLATALLAEPRLRFVDLRASLRAGKTGAQLYYATDSHWNMLGAAVGYAELMREVQRAIPAGRLPAIAPAALPPYVPGVDVYRGDLARLIGLPARYREPDYAPFAKVLGDPSSRCAKRSDAGADAGFEFYACDRPGLPRAVVYRDSMAIPLLPLLSENFSRVVYVSSQQLDPALILRERPDVVIEEMVERLLLAPAASPMRELR